MLEGQKVFENNLLKIFIFYYFIRADSGLKVISSLYRGLQEVKIASTIYIEQKWGRDTKSCIPEEVWTKYCESQWRISGVFGWKSLNRYFITPVQKSHHSGSSSCWRKCGSQEANYYHLFWACPKVNAFWHKIYTELVTIFGAKITFNRDELLFGPLHSTSTNIKTKYLFGILSIAARKAITKKWLKPDTPSIDD